MKVSLALSIFVLAVLPGCAQKTMLLQGFDGRPIDPVAQQQYTAECRGKAMTASATVPYQGIGGGPEADRSMEKRVKDQRSKEQDQVQQAAFEGCMAEKGIRVSYQSNMPQFLDM